MITLKLWMTEKRKNYRLVYKKYWRGWFLFGIIPLYIENQKAEYYQ